MKMMRHIFCLPFAKRKVCAQNREFSKKKKSWNEKILKTPKRSESVHERGTNCEKTFEFPPLKGISMK